MSHANLHVYVACDFHAWSLMSLGLEVSANMRPFHDCPRWFSVTLGLLFLHVKLRIEGERTVPSEDDDD